MPAATLPPSPATPVSPLIRPARAADLDAIVTLEARGFADGVVESRAVFAARLAAFAAGFLVLEIDGRIAGYLCSEIWDEGAGTHPADFALGHDAQAAHRPDGRLLYVSSTVIDPDCRGGGYGRLLFRSALARAWTNFPALRAALLLVNEGWIAARRIYAGEGFAEIARFPGFFAPARGPAQAAIVMRLARPQP